MFKFFSVFLKDAATRFSRIARSVRGHIKPADLHADAWMLAAEIGDKRGREVDFSDPVDQELVLSRIYWSVKGQSDWRLGSAYSIDDHQEGRTPWADRLAAPKSTSPLEILLDREASHLSDSALAASYSQAAAYNIALVNFKSDRPTLCAHLLISGSALEHRMNSAFEVVRRQNSLFNGYQVIDRDFIPLAGRERAPAPAASVAMGQAELLF